MTTNRWRSAVLPVAVLTLIAALVSAVAMSDRIAAAIGGGDSASTADRSDGEPILISGSESVSVLGVVAAVADDSIRNTATGKTATLGAGAAPTTAPVVTPTTTTRRSAGVVSTTTSMAPTTTTPVSTTTPTTTATAPAAPPTTIAAAPTTTRAPGLDLCALPGVGDLLCG